MKKGIAFLLLLCHMNTSMFLPQVAELDQYDASGRQIDDINSVVEYVDQVVLGHHSKNRCDEDNDDGQNFTVATAFSYFFQQPIFEINHPRFDQMADRLFADHAVGKIPFISFDILVPPPKA